MSRESGIEGLIEKIRGGFTQLRQVNKTKTLLLPNRYQEERIEKEIFQDSDTFCAASLFVDPARELFDGGKTDNPFQFC